MRLPFTLKVGMALAFALGLPLTACRHEVRSDAGGGAPGAGTLATPIVPRPAQVERRAGVFTLAADTPVVVLGAHAEATRIARDFAARLEALRGFAPAVIASSSSKAASRHAIVFMLDPQAASRGDEGYELDVTPDGVRITARAPAGLFYGAVSLWQLATADGGAGPAAIAAQRIEDHPRFAWRGLMLDVARHFRTPDEVRALLDQMALHKLNTFHWHLTDDQGWRLEIEQYPKLTEVGACRIPAGAAGRDRASGAPRPYCGHYTQEEVRAIVRYAAERFITVVPEIEMPGHAQAAIAAYPELGVTDAVEAAPSVSPDWGIHTTLYNVEDGTFGFLENVLTEVMALFPSRYLHIGGDEAAKDQWQASPRVQAKKQALGLADEMALQSWFVTRIERFLNAHGRRLVGWDEILEGGLPPQATVMSWRGTQGAIDAARKGHDVVLSPAPDLYLDHVQSDAADEAPGRLGVITLQDIYGFEPVPAELTPAQSRHVLGAQANLWTEHLRTAARVEHAAFPRAAALAEVLWSPQATRDWDDFLARLVPQLERYRAAGFAYADSAFAVRFELARGADGGYTLSLGNQAGFGEIRIADGEAAPTPASPRYPGPLAVTPPFAFSANAYADGRALAAPRRFVDDDAAALSLRRSNALRSCRNGLTLRLEDDAPADGGDERAVFLVDVFDPCWIYEGAELDDVAAIAVRVGQLPYNFQLWRDTHLVVTRPATGPDGALEVRIDGCEGEPVAVLPLTAARRSEGVTTLEAALPPVSGRHDLCLVFASGAHDPMWVLDDVRLRARAER